MDDPMTKEEIGAAREWSGLGDEVTDEQIVEMTQGTLWLHSRRSSAAFDALGSAIMEAMRKDLAELRKKMVTGK